MSKENILKHLEECWQRLTKSLDGLSEKELMQPNVCGSWSARDMMGHITTWESEAMQNIPLILEGESTPRYSSSGGIDAFNARAQVDKKEYSLTRIKREFHSNHQRFMDYLSELPDSVFMNNARLAKRIRLDGYAHYDEHAAQIKKWRDSRIANQDTF
jgi:hypothetical protein